MPTPQTEVSEPSKITEPMKPLDEAALSQLLRQSLFADEEKQQPEAETQDETEDEAPEAEEAEETESEESEPESPETETEDAEEADEDEAKEDEAKDDLKKMPKGVQKRIDKLVAQKKELEAKLHELSEQTEELKSKAEKPEKEVIPVGKELNPYFNLQDEAEVHQEIRNARQVRRWAEENPDGAVVKGKDGEEVEYSAEDMRRIKMNAVDALEEHLPAQLQYLAAKKQFDAEADKAYPFWKDRSSQEYQYANALLREFPEIKKFPDYKVSLGDMIEGRKLRESKSKGKAKQVVKVAPKAPKTAATPVEVTSSKAKAMNAEAQFRKSPDERSLKALIAEKFL